jgi:hypothetical protein
MVLGVPLISPIVAVIIIVINKTGHITTSFSDTLILTRNSDGGVSTGEKLRLRAANDGKFEYTVG